MNVLNTYAKLWRCIWACFLFIQNRRLLGITLLYWFSSYTGWLTFRITIYTAVFKNYAFKTPNDNYRLILIDTVAKELHHFKSCIVKHNFNNTNRKKSTLESVQMSLRLIIIWISNENSIAILGRFCESNVIKLCEREKWSDICSHVVSRRLRLNTSRNLMSLEKVVTSFCMNWYKETTLFNALT